MYKRSAIWERCSIDGPRNLPFLTSWQRNNLALVVIVYLSVE